MIGWTDWKWTREKLFPQDSEPLCAGCKGEIKGEFYLGREVKGKGQDFVPWFTFCAECKLKLTGKV